MNGIGKNNSTHQRGKSALRMAGFVVIILTAAAALIFTLSMINNRSFSTIADSDAHSNTEQPLDKPEELNSTPPSSTGTLIITGDSEFGTMLFNEKKQAIYIWELEESAKAECYGDCAEAWPPVLTNGTPRASGEVKSSLLGTTKRSDGSTQVTYNAHPLYYYAHEAAGEVKCHNISTHGGLWWVIQPSGNRAS
ncbi:MAG TPA: hypothetical protein VGE34_02485 [Candidatus Saccharimonadales bacterium]